MAVVSGVTQAALVVGLSMELYHKPPAHKSQTNTTAHAGPSPSSASRL